MEANTESTEIMKTVSYLALGYDVSVEEFGQGRAKVSGRGAHYIRDAVEDDHRLDVDSDINQHAFYVAWNT